MKYVDRAIVTAFFAMGLVILLATLTACTPREGARCTNVGESVRVEGEGLLRCQTNDGQRTPRWTKV